MNWALFGVAGFMVYNSLAYIANIGKPREQPSSSTIILTTMLMYAIIVITALAAWRLTR